ncbi:glutathione S-transferase [Erwinia sp. OLTSP20]|uniref:glutathione S-transferase family protein n=1 Tax=unclassified Erwinia TaxID=2622719 RepID=UPI000C1799F4|nr:MULTISPECIES: glutathione S-transferase family protein [unclassified Erwinia]PIJ50755.1 glutathione S-transferase [Erwinia sp. OAMSP11]PIJ75424.1 glutathione S-transferase [Erwinia sp. OLSSP12]PIJ81922.1 glutathione S-transferase [Erwinia sp. OLCASP19]PIJ84577.1 glutathione S-transferase [Erwinia sp. OLMTSP26]PIJ86924.1 glutathione S-transferase [Erwinia sp. OLMDSP33]
MLKIWGRKTSSNVQALMWCVGELGLAYERYDIGHRFGGNDSAEFLAMNPNGLVPVLRDGDNSPVFETGAILRYLAARYADGCFWPQDLALRARVDMWAEWAKINVALGFTAPVFWQVVRTPAAQRDNTAVSQALARLTHFLRIAESRFEQDPWLAGNDFTLADIQFGHLLYRYYDIAIERPPLPALAAYYHRLQQRPAYVEHVMVSYEELRA